MSPVVNIGHVLRHDASSLELFQTFDDTVFSLVGIVDTEFLYHHSEERSDDVTVHIWHEQAENGATISLVENRRLSACYFFVSGSCEKQCTRIAKNLAYLLPVIPVDELLSAARHAGDNANALQLLALGLNTSFHEEAFTLITRSMQSKAESERLSAIAAATALKWRQFIPRLEAAMVTAASEDERQCIRFALERCQRTPEAIGHG